MGFSVNQLHQLVWTSNETYQRTHQLTRRQILRGAGVALALPVLDSFAPRLRAGEKAPPPPRRMVCICTPLGLHAPWFFPEKTGKEYELSPYLLVRQDFRVDFTVISGLSHPEVGSSYDWAYSFL